MGGAEWAEYQEKSSWKGISLVIGERALSAANDSVKNVHKRCDAHGKLVRKNLGDI